MYLLCTLGYLYIFLQEVAWAVQINFIRVPAAVENDTGTPVVLDCDYSLRPDDEGLVVKWFLNNGPSAVYQWIPSKKPQALGLLRDRVDLSYTATSDPRSAYRALKILNPTTDIAGDYKCFVSTFNDEDFSSKNMIVFVPEDRLIMYQGHQIGNHINFTCLSVGVYPEPALILYKNTEDSFASEPKKTLDIAEWTKSRHYTGRYDLTIVASAAVVELIPGDIIDCELRIPGTGYVKKKSLIYYPPLAKSHGASILSVIHIILVITVWLIIFI